MDLLRADFHSLQAYAGSLDQIQTCRCQAEILHHIAGFQLDLALKSIKALALSPKWNLGSRTRHKTFENNHRWIEGNSDCLGLMRFGFHKGQHESIESLQWHVYRSLCWNILSFVRQGKVCTLYHLEAVLLTSEARIHQNASGILNTALWLTFAHLRCQRSRTDSCLLPSDALLVNVCREMVTSRHIRPLRIDPVKIGRTSYQVSYQVRSWLQPPHASSTNANPLIS